MVENSGNEVVGTPRWEDTSLNIEGSRKKRKKGSAGQLKILGNGESVKTSRADESVRGPNKGVKERRQKRAAERGPFLGSAVESRETVRRKEAGPDFGAAILGEKTVKSGSVLPFRRRLKAEHRLSEKRDGKGHGGKGRGCGQSVKGDGRGRHRVGWSLRDWGVNVVRLERKKGCVKALSAL